MNSELQLPKDLPRNLKEKFMRMVMEQVDKDFCLSGLSGVSEFPLDIEIMANWMVSAIEDFVNQGSQGLSQFLYRVDVDERKCIELLQKNDLKTASEKITILVLKREMQKVWFKINWAHDQDL